MPDVPGQMLKLTKIMTDIHASFSQIIQAKNTTGDRARVVIITHEMNEHQLKDFKRAIAKESAIDLTAAYKVLD
jgi:homoserine dehydrogenase